MHREFLTKQGETVIKLAELLLPVSVNYRLPSVSECCNLLGAGSGTVQAALRALSDAGAINMEAHGHQGTVITALDRALLWRFSRGNSPIYGSLPLPNPTRYEGLATAMFELFERSGIPFSTGYVRGARVRVQRLLDRHADFVVCSLLSAEIALQENPSLTMLMDLGKETYMTNTMLIFAEPGHTEVEDGMRVGLDYSCYDHPEINRVASEGKNVTFVPVNYTNVHNMLHNREIDVSVCGLETYATDFPGLYSVPVARKGRMAKITQEGGNAVIIVRKGDDALSALLQDVLNLDELHAIQKDVMEGRKMPSY